MSSEESTPLVKTDTTKNFYFAPERTRSNTLGHSAEDSNAGSVETVLEPAPQSAFSIERTSPISYRFSCYYCYYIYCFFHLFSFVFVFVDICVKLS